MTLPRRDLPAVREAQDLSAATVPHLDPSAVPRIIKAPTTPTGTGSAVAPGERLQARLGRRTGPEPVGHAVRMWDGYPPPAR